MTRTYTLQLQCAAVEQEYCYFEILGGFIKLCETCRQAVLFGTGKSW